MAYGAGGTGSAGGLSFRSGAGTISFRGTRHAALDASALRPHATGASGASSFRSNGTGLATFRSGALPTSSSSGGGGAARAHVGLAAGASGGAVFRSVGVASFRPASSSVSASEAAQEAQVAATGDAGHGTQAVPKAGTREKPSVMQQLQQLGLAGVVAYGLLNTLYYSTAFLTVWFMVAKVPQGQGLAAAAKSFLAVFATVWAGSQVTKVARAAGALFLAPLVERGLGWVQSTFKLESKNLAFTWILLGCVSVALTVFGVVVVAWA